MKANFFITLIRRFASERPNFWKKVTTGGLAVMAILAAVLGLNEYEIISLPENWTRLLTHLSTFFAGVFVTGSATTANADLLDDKTLSNARKSDKLK